MNNVNYHTNFSPIDVTFEKTISAFTNGFHVRHIATYNLITCSPDDKVSEVFKKYPDFDQFPVQSNGMTIGVLERNGEGNESLVRDCMRRLDESILVAADEPLIHFLPLMTRPPYYRLILEGTKFAALVTRSDVLKLPVRLLGFTLITNLELLMKEIIASRMPDSESWLNLLSSNRRKKVECKRKAFVQKRVDPPLVELTDFCDKRVILKKYFHLPKRFEDDLKKIEDYRNSLAHAGTFVTNDDDLGEFIEAMSNARYWMSCLNNYSSKQDNKLLETSGTHRQVKELPTESGNKLR